MQVALGRGQSPQDTCSFCLSVLPLVSQPPNGFCPQGQLIIQANCQHAAFFCLFFTVQEAVEAASSKQHSQKAHTPYLLPGQNY